MKPRSLASFRHRLCGTALASALLGGCGGGGGDIDDALLPLILINDIALTLIGGQSAPFLGGDTIGGVPVLVFANITFELVDTTLPDGVTVVNGVVSVSSRAPLGNTTIRYRLCDSKHPGNCASGKLVLTVAGG